MLHSSAILIDPVRLPVTRSVKSRFESSLFAIILFVLSIYSKLFSTIGDSCQIISLRIRPGPVPRYLARLVNDTHTADFREHRLEECHRSPVSSAEATTYGLKFSPQNYNFNNVIIRKRHGHRSSAKQ